MRFKLHPELEPASGHYCKEQVLYKHITMTNDNHNDRFTDKSRFLRWAHGAACTRRLTIHLGQHVSSLGNWRMMQWDFHSWEGGERNSMAVVVARTAVISIHFAMMSNPAIAVGSNFSIYWLIHDASCLFHVSPLGNWRMMQWDFH